MRTAKVCSVEGCDKKHLAKGKCKRHYTQEKRGHNSYHDFSKTRSKTDPNEFVIEGDVCFIYLYDIKGNKIAEAIIDAEDYEKCKSYKWHSFKDGENIRVSNHEVGLLAPYILNFKSSHKIVADHKDGKTLDNRKQNLQIITNQQNSMKRKINKNNTSGYKGVSWSPRLDKWAARIGYNGKCFSLGCFSDKKEAALIYNKKAKELFGSFATLNQV